MDRLIATDSVNLAGADTAPGSGTPQYATSGNPGSGIPATVLPAYAWNAIQEELVGIILAAGIALDKTNNGQVLAALKLINAGAVQYVNDTGAANAYVGALTPAITVYTTYQLVVFQPTHANTTASTINLGGGVVPLVRSDLAPTQAGDVDPAVGAILLQKLPGGGAGFGIIGPTRSILFASPTLTGNPTAPTQSPGDNTIKLANTAFVTAAIAAIASQKLAKAWLVYNGSTGTVIDSYGISGVVKNTTGSYTVTFSSAFGSANYAGVVSSDAFATNGAAFSGQAWVDPSGKIAASCTILSKGPNNAALDGTLLCAVFYGS